MTDEKRKSNPRRKSKQLRGELLIEAALHALANTASWEGELSWAKLEDRVGASRQAMSRHQKIADAFDAAKKAVRDGRVTAQAIIRKSAEERIEALKEENQRLNKIIDGYLEKWLQMEANCLALQIDPRKILGPSISKMCEA